MLKNHKSLRVSGLAPSLLPVKTYVNYDTWGHGPSKVPGELSVLEMQQQIMSSWILKLGRAVLSSPTWERNFWVGFLAKSRIPRLNRRWLNLIISKVICCYWWIQNLRISDIIKVCSLDIQLIQWILIGWARYFQLKSFALWYSEYSWWSRMYFEKNLFLIFYFKVSTETQGLY